MVNMAIKNTSLIIALCCFLTACFNDDDSNPDTTWREGEYLSAGTFSGFCYEAAERFFMRSLFNEFYYWYEDIVDTNPNLFSGLVSYFDYLVTDDLTPSGKRKDAYSTLLSSTRFGASINNNVEIGYGMRLTYVNDEDIATVAFVAVGSPADLQGIKRGDRIVSVDAFTLDMPEAEEALYPARSGETYTFSIDVLGGTNTPFTMTSAAVAMPSTGVRDVLNGSIGYLQFNDHSALAEEELVAHFTALANNATPLTDLILDLRYNSGGFLYIASQVAYMIAGQTATDGKVFETLLFNDRFTPEDIPFETVGFNSANQLVSLPTLDLPRVFILSGSDTCSASESIINALRGIGIEVILIGDTTCGKPYGFYGFDNCGVTYLPTAFEGVNDMYAGTLNEDNGRYIDGFKPEGSGDVYGIELTGCAVADDFDNALGDENEERLAAALTYIASGNCPVTTVLSTATSSGNGPAVSSGTSQHPAAFKYRNGLKLMR